MNWALSYVVIGLGCFLMAACSPVPAEMTEPVKSSYKDLTDADKFEAMLTRTDEVEVCVEYFVENDTSCSNDVDTCVNIFLRPACQCQSDYMRLALRDAGANDALENAVIQMAMNFEVGYEIWPDENLRDAWRDFGPFLTAHADENFAANHQSKLESAAAIMNDQSYDDLPRLLEQLPACEIMISRWDQFLPDRNQQADLFKYFIGEFPLVKAAARQRANRNNQAEDS